MIYPTNFEHKIGFDKIRQLLSDKCLSPLGNDKVEEMNFSIHYDEVRALLCQTEEFVRILQLESDFPANYFFDVRQSLKKVR
ncbi:MAG: endonuclease MutS2, partial [Bacteroidales bacterium]